MNSTDEQNITPDEQVQPEDGPDQADVTDEVIEMSPEAAQLVHDLQAQLAEAEEARLRALAEYRNGQRRAIENEARARTGAISDVIKALLPVLDQFDMALAQDLESVTVTQFAEGVGLAQQEMSRVLATLNVQRIEPAPGDEFDPERHEAMTRMPSDDVEPNNVLSTYQVGFALDDVVLRAAKVVVAAPRDED